MPAWILLVVFLAIAVGLLAWLLRALARETASPVVMWTVGLIGAALILGGAYALGQGSVADTGTYSVSTAPDASGELKSRVYSAPPNEVYRDAVIVTGGQQSFGQPWRVVVQRTTPISGGTFQAEIPYGLWKNTLDANIRPESEGVQVDVIVRAPLILGWLGVPQREAAQFLQALDAKVVNR